MSFKKFQTKGYYGTSSSIGYAKSSLDTARKKNRKKGQLLLRNWKRILKKDQSGSNKPKHTELRRIKAKV